MCHVTKYSTILGVFQQPWPGVSTTASLNEEKALGTRLGSQSKNSQNSHTKNPTVTVNRFFLKFVSLSQTASRKKAALYTSSLQPDCFSFQEQF